MTDQIDALKQSIRSLLRNAFDPVPPARESSRQVHLEVWRTAHGRTRAVGLEMGHADLVNLWVTTMNAPANLPPSVLRTDKVWDRDRWTDAGNDGANSNLKSYDDFRGKKITRLGVKTIDDARMILEHLTQ
jgi:hypothetical protein